MKGLGRRVLFTLATLFSFFSTLAQDDCSTASQINLPNNGYGLGTINSTVIDISTATVQPGEFFAGVINAAGQNQKSIWFKFSLPTTRSINLVLGQIGSSITNGEVGATVYKTNNCLPSPLEISSKLSPIASFGSISQPCLDAGTYLIQVSSKNTTTGNIYIQITTSLTNTTYDETFNANAFGTLTPGTKTVNYSISCQSVTDDLEICSALPSTQYNRSTWHVFRTPAYFDYISLLLTNQILPAGQTYGVNIYKGDVRLSPSILMSGCNVIQSNAYKSAQKTFTCADLDPNTTYSIQIFYHQTFTDNVQLSLITGGTTPTAAPKPVLSSMPAANTITLTPSASGNTVALSEYLACNSRHSLTNCPPALSLTGINYNNRNFDLSSFFSFSLTSTASLNLSATPSCGPTLLIQLYKQALTNNCSDLSPANLLKQSISTSLSSCLPPGDYVIQVSGTDSAIQNTYAYGALTNGTTPLCLLSNLGSAFTLNVTATLPLPANQTIDSTLCEGKSFTLANGATIVNSGSYKDTLRSVNGCDSVARVLNLVFKTKTILTSSIDICKDQAYTLPSGKIVTGAGVYNDTLYYKSGCDSVINIVNLSEKPLFKQTIDTFVCKGSSYFLPSGIQVSAPGIYYDTVKYTTGCDSLITEVNLDFKSATNQVSNINLCSGQTYMLPWGIIVNTAGEYRDTLRYFSGCDSVINIITVSVTPVIHQIIDTAICENASYLLPSGFLATTPGNYFDTVRHNSGCDSLTTELHLSIKSTAIENNNVTICNGQNYTLPWGAVVNADGVYRDTLHYTTGCDSVVRLMTVSVQNPLILHFDTTICEGAIYILPWGIAASGAGSYSDTLHFATGCDSLIRSVQLTVKNVERKDSSVTICSGQTFITPSGISIAATGIYLDTLRYATGCDSVIYRLSIVVNSVAKKSFTASVCDGNTYMLPSGKIISSAGNYNDTLRYASGCDSVIYSIQLITNSTQHQNTTINICSGQTYTLPWGIVVNSAGSYSDTLHYTTGCDSLIRIVQVTVNTPTVMTSSATICSGSAYTLPSGATVNAAGIYRDTLFYTTGCDSLIRILNLSVSPVVHKISSLNLCEGGSVILPWGISATAPGLYRDTLHYTNGCDSVISEVTVLLNPVIRRNTTVSFCAGTAYTLPWGTVVTAAGSYRDTLHYTSGCDSIITTIQLIANTLNTITSAASICSSQTFTLPWGTIVSVAGVYADTLRYASGCDSVIRIVQVSVTTPVRLSINAAICVGHAITLPSGKTVTTPGNFSDTIHNAAGCDSVIYDVNITTLTPATQFSNITICAGRTYSLPWGSIVNSAGVYRDTVRSISGCDSIYRVITLAIFAPSQNTIAASVCYGKAYTLPSGKTVFTPGLYMDTLLSSSGCDSIITTVALTIQTPATLSMQASICVGQSYMLPWGRIVNTAGVYRDTLKYTTGCDSLFRVVDVQTISAKTISTNASVCRGENYVLPWGTAVKNAGTYSDTLRTTAGCDSVIRIINLAVIEKPVVSVSKSNDINCTLGSAKLTATGGYQYQWSPAAGLDKTDVFNPLAAPSTTTVYHVQVTSAYGCTSLDSVEIVVTNTISAESFLMPNAFTPNGDNLNDCFGVRHWGTVSNLHFSIYDRWGKLVFYTENPSQCWDGLNKDKQLPSGTYVYAISAKTICGDVQRKGTVTLIR